MRGMLLLVLLLSGCQLKQPGAPVIDLYPHPMHIVIQGESLYTIAWKYSRDYQELAQINQIHSPYVIYPGQKIYLKSARSSSKPLVKATVKKTALKVPPALNNQKPISSWQWPVRGKIIKSYSAHERQLNKGIDISGRLGTPIQAASSGKVVYSGSGLRGYGQMIIIKHNEAYLSAYAHNSQLLVHEGQVVEQGQIIAKMGKSDADQIKLHFEIRKNGQPINPLILLPATP